MLRRNLMMSSSPCTCMQPRASSFLWHGEVSISCRHCMVSLRQVLFSCDCTSWGSFGECIVLFFVKFRVCPAAFLFPMMNNCRSLSLCCWNVRGLGDSDKCDFVRDTLISSAADIVLLQETKLHDISTFKLASFLPQSSSKFVHVEADGASGGLEPKQIY